MITSWKTPALLIETLVPLHLPNAQAVPSMSPKLRMHIYTFLPTAWKTTGRRRRIIQSANPLFDIDITKKRQDCQALYKLLRSVVREHETQMEEQNHNQTSNDKEERKKNSRKREWAGAQVGGRGEAGGRGFSFQ